jgi:hypothetical protein
MVVLLLAGPVAAQEPAANSLRPGRVADASTHSSSTDAASLKSNDLRENTGWYAGIASGYYFPVQAWPTTYQLGGGGMFLLGDQLNRHWAVQLDLNMWLFSGNGRDTWDLKTGPVLVWTPSERTIAPFFLAGAGVDFQTDYPAQVSGLAPTMSVGAGVRFAMGVRNAFFIEARQHFVLRSVTTRDVPVLAGFRLAF